MTQLMIEGISKQIGLEIWGAMVDRPLIVAVNDPFEWCANQRANRNIHRNRKQGEIGFLIAEHFYLANNL